MSRVHFTRVEVCGVVCREPTLQRDRADRRPALCFDVQVQGEAVRVRAFDDAVIAKLSALPLWSVVHVVGHVAAGGRIVITGCRDD